MRPRRLAWLGAALAGVAVAFTTATATTPASWCVAVWYPSSEHPGGAASITENLDVIDIVHPFWFTPDASGVLLDQSGANAAEQVRYWQAAGALVLPSVFSGHAGYLMTYDFTNRNEPPGPAADLGWVSDVVAYALTTTGAEKVRVGLPFYGYGWTRGRPPARATTWEAAARLMEQFGLLPERDTASAELTLELDVTGLPRQVVYVSDAATTAARLDALRGSGTGGVAIWGVGGEDPVNWQVLREERPAACAHRGAGADR